MSEDKVVPFRPKDEIDDPLTEILRAGAKRLIEQAVEAEFSAFLCSHAALKLPDGRQRVVRHGHDPVRPIQTGIGPVEVEKPKARDRGASSAEERIRYSSSILGTGPRLRAVRWGKTNCWNCSTLSFVGIDCNCGLFVIFPRK